MTITRAKTDAGVITHNYNVRGLARDLNADDEIIACALLETDELLKTRQFNGYESIGTIQRFGVFGSERLKVNGKYTENITI